MWKLTLAIVLSFTFAMFFCGNQSICIAGELAVREQAGGVGIETQLYKVFLSKEKGYTIDAITNLQSGGVLKTHNAGLVVVEDPDSRTWKKQRLGRTTDHHENKAKATCKVQKADNKITCTISWKNAVVKVEKTMVFNADSPVINISYRVRMLRPLQEVSYFLDVLEKSFKKKSNFYPGATRVPRLSGIFYANFEQTPGYAYWYDGQDGYGLLGDVKNKTVSTLSHSYYQGCKAYHVAAHAPSPRWQPISSVINLDTSIVLGLKPDQVVALYQKRNLQLTRVEIAEVEVEKLIYRLKENGRAFVLLRNNTQEKQSVTLSSRIAAGINDVRELPKQTVEIAPASDKKVPVVWDNQGMWGFELSVDVLDNGGNKLDSGRDYFSVVDDYWKVGQVTTWNPAWMKKTSTMPAMVRQCKQNYLGVIEFYCWAPCQVFDLTPDTEKFEPHTESQASYRTSLTRTFLKDMVDAVHQDGLRVLAMDTGMASLDGALDNPELMKYTEDGQMWVYNDKFHDGKRFSVMVSNIFDPTAIKNFAEEMSASINMFGWDGVRFDWAFLPIAPADPKFHSANQKRASKISIYDKAGRTDWFFYDGKSAHEIYPDPDINGANLCQIYRDTLAEDHPEFGFSANFSATYGLAEEFPKWAGVQCGDAGVLMENLLNVYTRYSTWRVWANELIKGLRLVRGPFRSHTFVGWMDGYAYGGIGHRNIQYITMAAGFHWYGYIGPRYSIDDSYLRFRHAMRFSEYFYDTAFKSKKNGEAMVNVNGENVDRILWKPFVFERDRKNQKDMMVHLINLPKNDYFAMHHEIPALKKDVDVTFSVDPAFTPAKCWVLVPEPYPHAEKLDFQVQDDGKVRIRLDTLKSIGTVILNVKKK